MGKKVLITIVCIIIPLLANSDDYRFHVRYNDDGVELVCKVISNEELTCEVDGYHNFSKPLGTPILTELIVPSHVNYGGKTYTVISIDHIHGNYIGDVLTSVVIPNTVTSLGGFSGCHKLESIKIPNSVKKIDHNSFSKCEKLKSIKLPDSVTEIGYHVFEGSGITEPVFNSHMFVYMPKDYEGAYKMPDGIETIAREACQGCKNLTSVELPNSVKSVGFDAFRRSGIKIPIYNSRLFAFLPDDYEGEYVVPYGIERIESAAFAHCEKLTSVIIPSTVKEIGPNQFQGCINLKSVTIGESVSSIGGLSFWDTPSLTEVISMNPNPPVIHYNLTRPSDKKFTKKDVLKVPREAVMAYKAVPYWRSTFKKILPLE